MKIRFVNRLCAYPAQASGLLGAIIMVTLLCRWLFGQDILKLIEPVIVVMVVVAIVSSIALGIILGMFVFWPWVRVVCSWANGAPLRAGDKVIILRGPGAGKSAIVKETVVGQGGWAMVTIQMDGTSGESGDRIFETYFFLKSAK